MVYKDKPDPQGANLEWGFASSPIIYSNRVFLQCDVLTNGFVAALDIADGREVWHTRRDDTGTWSTPNISPSGPRPQLIVNGWKHMGGYDLNTGEARYITDLSRETRAMIDSSHRLAGQLLSADKELSASLPREKVYVLDTAGHIVVNQYGDMVHTAEYVKIYHQRLGGMIEQQLRGAIAETSAFWYTAWVNAGKPDLSDLDPAALTKRNRRDMDSDLRRWRQGKVEMVKPSGEFGRWVRSGR